MAGNLLPKEKENMMEFDYNVNDLEDLSEWPDSLDFGEFCDANEIREEPLAKRQKTAIDCDDHGRLQTQMAGRF